MALFDPFFADCESVGYECVFVVAPHVGGWMVLPAFLGVGEGVEDLKCFDALFAEALPVEAFGDLGEVGVGEECLHGVAFCR